MECPQCGNVHFEKQWFESKQRLKEHFKKHLRREKLDEVQLRRLMARELPVGRQRMCPACAMVQNRTFEGEVLAVLMPKSYRGKFIRTVKNFGKTAIGKDPQDRIISIEALRDGYRVAVSDNTMADRLARKIHHAFAATKIHYSRAPGPRAVSRVRIVFGGK